MSDTRTSPWPAPPLQLAVLWIDWYAYHVARFEGLLAEPRLAGRVAGIELVGGVGVHAGLKFREELPSDLPVHTLLPEANWQGASKLRLACLLWKQLDQLNPAAVLVPGYYTLPAIAAALWARAHNRFSILMTESTAYDHKRVAWKEMAKSLLLRMLFDKAVAGGKAHLRYLEKLHFPADRVARFYDVVDNAALATAVTTARRRTAASSGLPSRPYFLYVGRLAPEKNIDTLLKAWISFRKAGGDWPLVLVGDGPSAASLREIAAQCPFGEDVCFAGHRGSRELPTFYAFAGCFVLPSLREPWGLVVNEAMACSLPVLVSSQCGSAEDLVVEGRNGFTFPPHDEDQLSRLMSTIASLRDNARLAMGQESNRLIAPYSPQSFGREIAAMLGNTRTKKAAEALIPSKVTNFQ